MVGLSVLPHHHLVDLEMVWIVWVELVGTWFQVVRVRLIPRPNRICPRSRRRKIDNHPPWFATESKKVF